MSTKNNIEELSDDMEVIGPGQILSEARIKAGLSQQQVAEKLNFRTTLVNDIEQDIFDRTLPATFNRGYLKNYAKLVNISEEEILASYETLNVAEKQGAEMQSFSKETEKQAESNLVMWIGYLILAFFLGSTILWWIQDLQDTKPNSVSKAPTTVEKIKQKNEAPNVEANTQQENAEKDNAQAQAQSQIIVDEEKTTTLSETLKEVPIVENIDDNDMVEDNNSQATNNAEVVNQTSDRNTALPSTMESEISTTLENSTAQRSAIDSNSADSNAIDSNNVEEQLQAAEEIIPVDFGPTEAVTFFFSGDCWVNIYDATGERIAWGIKKSGYEMNITGQAPFEITLGKPELVAIKFENEDVDMSQFSRGNIAKFNLPLE